MGIQDEALRLHANGYNCAQSVLTACREYTGLPDETALALSAGFGGGVRCGEICGAVSGAVMALGMHYPFSDGTDAAAKNRIGRLAGELTSTFAEEFGCIRCQDLKRKGICCDTLIAYAAKLAEEKMKEE